jgi:hypothetical protein
MLPPPLPAGHLVASVMRAWVLRFRMKVILYLSRYIMKFFVSLCDSKVRALFLGSVTVPN